MHRSAPHIILLALCCIYVLMLARWGYEYGRGDQMQIISYSQYMNDQSLFTVDPYIQGIAEKVPNERYVFAKFMSFFGDKMELASLVLHAFSGLFLLLLLFKIAREFIETDYLIWLGLLFLFIFMYGINLGGNELYYNTFFVSTPAKALGLWGFWHFLKSRYTIAFLLFGITCVLQAVVGLQLFVTCAGILCISKFSGRNRFDWLDFVKWLSGFILTGGIWIFFMKFFFEETASANIDFFSIFFEFRAPHHYVPHEFPLKNYLILFPLMIFGSIYYLFHNYKMFWFFLISFIGMGCYTIAFYGLRDVNLVTLQWFKLSLWLKPFALIAVIAWLEKKMEWVSLESLQRLAFPVLIMVGCAVFSILIFARSLFFWPVPFDFGNQYTEDPRVEICLQAKQQTPVNALFVHPIDFVELKVYGNRSGFVDYKALSHRKVEMQGWYDRTKALYAVDQNTNTTVDPLFDHAHRNYRSLKASDFRRLANDNGITHVLTWNDHKLNLPTVASNGDWVIYKIGE